jgi:hypothetical protein
LILIIVLLNLDDDQGKLSFPSIYFSRSYGRNMIQEQMPIQAAVTFLVGPEQKDLDDFKHSLTLYANFSGILSRYPIYVFHEGGRVSEERLQLSSIATNYLLRFVQVELGPREGFDPLTPLWTGPHIKRGGLSYFNMIRWNVVSLFEHPEISKVDFVMRLDSDSEVKSTIKEDLFAAMALRHVVYAYKIDSFEAKDFGVTEGLANFARSYMHAMSIEPKNLNIYYLPDDGSMPAFYNNFEIIYIPFLHSKSVRNFTKAIDGSDMIYRKRWGDAPIRYLTMNIFAEPEEIWKISRDVFHYCHAPKCD